jgi:cysteine desulfurase
MTNGRTLYFDYQASTPVDPEVFDKMQTWQTESFGNPHSLDHIFGWQAQQAVDRAAAEIASFIGADLDEIIFTSGATEANNLALLGIGRRAAGGERSRILVSAIEHKSVLAPCRELERHGYHVELLPVDSHGVLDIEALHRMISDTVLLLSVMAVNNEIGSIQPLAEIAEATRKHGIIFHCDAAQAPCAVEMGALAGYADLISLSAHKMYGPKGIGTLRIRRDLQDRIEPLFYGGGQQHDIRAGTLPVPLCVGMAAAVELLRGNASTEDRRVVAALRDRFLRRLEQAHIEFIINGSPAGQQHPGNLSLRLPGRDAHEILGAVQPRLAASIGSACASGTIEPSYVLRAIGLSDLEAQSTMRFSFGRFTTADDVDEAVSILAGVLSQRAEAPAVTAETAVEA